MEEIKDPNRYKIFLSLERDDKRTVTQSGQKRKNDRYRMKIEMIEKILQEMKFENARLAMTVDIGHDSVTGWLLDYIAATYKRISNRFSDEVINVKVAWELSEIETPELEKKVKVSSSVKRFGI